MSQTLPDTELQLPHDAPLSPSVGDAPPTPVSNARIVFVLILLVAAHLAVRFEFRVQAFMSPGKASVFEGVCIAQPFLVAMFAIFAPLWARVRLLLAAAVWAAPIVWAWVDRPSPWHSEYAAFLVAFVGPLLPYAYFYRFRRWRVSLADAACDVPLPPAQFSLRALMLTVGVSSLILAAGRGLYLWSQSGSEWSTHCAFSGLVTAYLAVASMFPLPCLGWALALRKRRQFLLWSLASCAGVLMFASLNDGFANTYVPVLCAYGAMLATLLPLRWCGFRLIQVGRAAPVEIEQPQPAIAS